MHPPRVLGAAGALLTSGALVATALVPASDRASREITWLFDGRVPLPVLALVFVLAALAPVGILASAHDRLAAVGLTVAATASLAPLWAASPQFDARLRAGALAAAPVAVAGLALMTRSRAGAALAVAAAALHVLAYDPFRDLGCAWVCLEVPVLVRIPTSRLTLLVAMVLTLAAALALAGAWRHVWRPWPAAAGAGVLAALAVGRWLTVGDAEVYGDLTLLAVPVPGLVALPAVVGWLRAARRRSAVRRLADQLSEDPDELLGLGARVDVSLLSAGQQLAVHNARLAAESRSRLTEVQASQRRIVAAADAERRRIERDLHDGTQQRLVGVLMQLSGLGRVDIEHQVREVLADLRLFSHGTFPPVLEEEGLAVALAELAAISDADLRLDLTLDVPVRPEQGRAVYALVARQNSGALDVSVSSSDTGVNVTLDGCGNVDLDDVRDRFGALGGTLSVSASRIEGWLPCEW